MNECYINYPERIKSAGLNGFNNCQIIDAPPIAPVTPAMPKIENQATVEVNINGETYSGTLNNKFYKRKRLQILIFWHFIC